jgi:hypothetical protein
MKTLSRRNAGTIASALLMDSDEETGAVTESVISSADIGSAETARKTRNFIEGDCTRRDDLRCPE